MFKFNLGIICIITLVLGCLSLGCNEETYNNNSEQNTTEQKETQKTILNENEENLFTTFEKFGKEDLNIYIKSNKDRWSKTSPPPERVAKVEINEELLSNNFQEGDKIQLNVFDFKEEAKISTIDYFDIENKEMEVIRGEVNTGNYFSLSQNKERNSKLLQIKLPKKGKIYRTRDGEQGSFLYLEEIDPQKIDYIET